MSPGHKPGLGGRLAPGTRPAVIVVDLINGFTDPSFPAGSDQDDVVRCTRSVIDTARECAAPVIFTTIVFPATRLDSTVWLRKMPAMRGLVPGSRWIEVDQRLAPVPGETVITKQAASAFTDTDLAALLASMATDTLIVCGATTSGCVRATAVDACMAGYPVFVPRDCVGDRFATAHEASLFDIDAKYGDVIERHRAREILASSRWPRKNE